MKTLILFLSILSTIMFGWAIYVDVFMSTFALIKDKDYKSNHIAIYGWMLLLSLFWSIYLTLY